MTTKTQQNDKKKEKTRSAILIDANYIVKNDKTYVKLQLKAKSVFYLYDEYLPYIYVGAQKKDIEEILKTEAEFRTEKIRPLKAEEVERELEGKKQKVLKVYFKHPFHVPVMRQALNKYKRWEHDILFGRRYMIDKDLSPLTKITYRRIGRKITKILKTSDATPKFRIFSFDIETYNPQGAPRPQKDPAIMISYCDGENLDDAKVLTYKDIPEHKYVKNCGDEKGMIEQFSKIIEEKNPEIITGYNSTNFDLPYLEERSKISKAKLAFGRDGSSFEIKKRGLRDIAKIEGRIYIDLFSVLRFLAFIGAVKMTRFTLEAAYESIVGKKSEWKEQVEGLDIYKMWDDQKRLPKLAEYARIDAHATWELAKKILPLELEMSKVTHVPPTDVIGATSSQLVESLLMYEASKRGAIVPNKPHDAAVRSRMDNPIEGAFVKQPNPGIYEKIMVFDFRGLYPSIIISHNIDPFTLLDKDSEEKEYYQSPTGAKFAKTPKGLIPDVLERVIKTRGKLKDKLKILEADTEEYRAVWARQQSLKILANSYYGYLAFARSRYYSRSAAESVTAWGRQFITDTGKQAEEAGFELLYQDTDSAFILLGDKTKEDALRWMREVNKTLPGTMELELEGYFPRGVFVSKKAIGSKEATGAKKKYALIDEKGKLKIKGFELVRRDWSTVAKQTQRNVLDAILKDGSKEKAVKIVRDTINQIKEGKMPLEKFVIQTQLTKDFKDYEAKSPELAAALKYNATGKGEKLARNSIVRFVITKSGGTPADLYKGCKNLNHAKRTSSSKAPISEKAEVVEMAKDYDADYYIDHQIIPSVLRILKELGVSEDDLKMEGKQQGLEAFF